MLISKNISTSWKLIISILVCETVGFISGLFSMKEMNLWLSSLNAPSWSPPSYLLGPIWAFLYFILGASFWLIWKNETPRQIKSITQLFFLLQLLFNFLWPILFFAAHSPFLALVDISLMIGLTLVVIICVFQISQLAALLLISYLSWISFAAALNYTIWSLNK